MKQTREITASGVNVFSLTDYTNRATSAYRAQWTQNLHSPARVILCTIPVLGEHFDARNRWSCDPAS